MLLPEQTFKWFGDLVSSKNVFEFAQLESSCMVEVDLIMNKENFRLIKRELIGLSLSELALYIIQTKPLFHLRVLNFMAMSHIFVNFIYIETTAYA